MAKCFQVLFMIIIAAIPAHAQSFHLGRCLTPELQKDFDINKYLGQWYEIEKLPAVFEKGTCNQAKYSLLDDGTVQVRNAELLANGKINSIEGVAKVKDSIQSAILKVKFFKGVPDAPYWVLSTDYVSHALVYSCIGYLRLFHIDFAWVLARNRTLPDDVISQLHDALAVAGVNINRLTFSNQTGCPDMS
ncbi:apolipoprotein D-like [Hypomesus transpacificus]|uniref:apolipoprotein D-like n=1 Tax=Hypomesus transpacificus TaxID=137520 RepID=UPI001F087E4A|nr:apolipoprotein D-like [Hypomesus transpacificus]